MDKLRGLSTEENHRTQKTPVLGKQVSDESLKLTCFHTDTSDENLRELLDFVRTFHISAAAGLSVFALFEDQVKKRSFRGKVHEVPVHLLPVQDTLIDLILESSCRMECSDRDGIFSKKRGFFFSGQDDYCFPLRQQHCKEAKILRFD